ncbi:uncharacterized protein E5676_scaffold682G00190 [Cucumis melo var. makuwa]|uniref:Uncharacterized protein n=1 Tax=Cucumis melo var. makuwa TaxID=1194695 RepID=A0A5D3DB64_CUCMM|nr:uncharacterized protein E6C27_scaffold17G00190 [Cucumis melo var. makuwa]TYK20857.1 uncharacterized protein E5676_scaffold682G00190 [Cucumis melo var. makuwa]
MGTIPMELWTEVGLVVVANAIDVNSNMSTEITVNLKGVDFIVLVQQEEVISEVVSNEGVDPTFVASGDVVLESFKQGCGKSWEVTMPNSFGNLIDLGVVMGDFNAIRLHFEAFGGTLVLDDMEELILLFMRQI